MAMVDMKNVRGIKNEKRLFIWETFLFFSVGF